jgi:hypothetical protein
MERLSRSGRAWRKVSAGGERSLFRALPATPAPPDSSCRLVPMSARSDILVAMTLSLHTLPAPDATARAVRVVCRLLACPAGQTRAELAGHFGWTSGTVAPLLAWLSARGMVQRCGERYRAAPDVTTRG